MGDFIAFVTDYISEIFLGFCIFLATKLGKQKTAEKLKKIRDKKIRKLKRRDIKLIEKLQADQTEIEELEKEQEKWLKFYATNGKKRSR